MFLPASFTLLLPEDEQRFVYRRDTETEHMLVICNFSAETAPLEEIEIPASRVPQFKAGKALKDVVAK